MLRRNGVEDLIGRLEGDGAHRVLRRLGVKEGLTGVEEAGDPTSVAIVVDVETTGLDPDGDVVIELAMRRFRHDELGRILLMDKPHAWREDPGRALHPDIVRLTGLTDADLLGRSIDDAAASRLLRSADLVIAHNAAFDRKFVERRLPAAAGLAWACSCVEIDWPARGFDGRGLGWLTAQAGWFYDGHRAENDVDAVIALLCQQASDGTTALAELVDNASRASVRVEAVGADFAVKGELRARGYRWNSDARVWWREVFSEDLPEEASWLDWHVYSPEFRPRAAGPRLTGIGARERHA